MMSHGALIGLACLLGNAADAVSAVLAPDGQLSTVVLANGVVMPRVLLGMGPWCTYPTVFVCLCVCLFVSCAVLASGHKKVSC